MNRFARFVHTFGLAMMACLVAPLVVRAADVHALRPTIRTGSTTQVEVLLEVGGDLKLNDRNLPRLLKTSVVGRLKYHERLMHASADQTEVDALRWYDQAEATVKIDDHVVQPKLRADRQLIAVHLMGEHATLVSPSGPLTQDELELVDMPACSIALPLLLPMREVAIDEPWQIPDHAIGILVGLDLVSQSEVTARLKRVEGDNYFCELAGSAQGAVSGVATSIEVKGRYKFNRAAGFITWLAMLVEEKRTIGSVGPGTDVVARLQMTLAPVTTPAELADDLVKQVPWQADVAQETLECRLAVGRFQFLHDRRWHEVDETNDRVAMRLVDRGELVAQCNVSVLPPGRDVTLERFQDDIRRSLDKHFGSFLQANEATSPQGYKLYRVVAEGRVADLPIQWIYYRLVDQQGNQAVFAVTVEQQLIERLAEAEQALVTTAEFVR